MGDWSDAIKVSDTGNLHSTKTSATLTTPGKRTPSESHEVGSLLVSSVISAIRPHIPSARTISAWYGLEKTTRK